MQRSGTAYTLGFATLICVICSVMVCGAAVVLKSRQDLNVVLDKQIQVLKVAGILKPGEPEDAATVARLFGERIQVKVVDLKTGDAVPPPFEPFDMEKAVKTPEFSAKAPANPAGVSVMPQHGMVYEVTENGQVVQHVLQVWGQGLWSTMYAYFAMDKDCETIRGLAFYKQGETPGLGGEIQNPRWVAQWPGRKAYMDGEPAIKMVKAGRSRELLPHEFDGVSGSTITSRGVENLLNYWLGDAGYGPYIKKASGVKE